ncbi:MAG: hypothetical protein KC609_19990, partial [Myxococcales bacterium]|nr:hypothetical protein [Myxococcales bacterium]
PAATVADPAATVADPAATVADPAATAAAATKPSGADSSAVGDPLGLLPNETREYFSDKAEVEGFFEKLSDWLRTLGESVDVREFVDRLKELEEPARKLLDEAGDLGKTYFGLDHLERAYRGVDAEGKSLDWFQRTLNGMEGIVDLLSSLPLPVLQAIPPGRLAKLLLFFQQSHRVNSVKTMVKVVRTVNEAWRGATRRPSDVTRRDAEREDGGENDATSADRGPAPRSDDHNDTTSADRNPASEGADRKDVKSADRDPASKGDDRDKEHL